MTGFSMANSGLFWFQPILGGTLATTYTVNAAVQW